MFAGSGTTGKAAILEGFYVVLIEKETEYIPIIRGRCEHAEKLFETAKHMTEDEAREAFKKSVADTSQHSLDLNI